MDSQPDYTPSAPPEEMVTGLYPSLDGLEEMLNRNDARQTQEITETPRANSGEGKLSPHEGTDCETVVFNCANHIADCQDGGKKLFDKTTEEIVESYYHCARCRPEHELCEYCFVIGKAVVAEMVKEYATEEEESPEVVCVTCLITGHQGGKECHLPKDECENCGRSHNWMLTCMEVRLYLKHGGDPMSHARPVLNEKTPMEDICPNCLDLLHHSCRPCQKKESPSGSDRVAPLSSNNSKKDSPESRIETS